MHRLDVVSASAGTGKTWRLTEEMAEAVLGGRAAPEGLVAITYTRKAAGELRGRLRRRLLSAGHHAEAARIRDGYIGTIHAVCHALLEEFALPAGLPARLDPLDPVVRTTLLREALADVENEDGDLDRLAARLGVDWQREVAEVVGRAQENGLGPEALAASAEASVATWRALLPAPRGEVTRRDAEFLAALAAALPALDAAASESKAAAERAELAASLLARADRDGAPPWDLLVKAGRALDVRKLAPVTGAFVKLATAHADHPRFHADTEGLIRGVLGTAARVLAAFERRKRRARVVDYEDMIALAAGLLAEPVVAEALRERLDLVLVDEVQDCAPIHLAVVSKLAGLARRTVLVGDRKQAIYGFQGADPELVRAAALHATGGRPPEILDRCFRSRPPLVAFCSEVFAAALASQGFSPEEVRVSAARPDTSALRDEPVLECWAWRPGKDSGRGPTPKGVSDAVADGVARLLADATLVREGDDVRPVRPGDIAVLARSGSHGRAVVRALLARGIPAAAPVRGLRETLEARLLRAALAVVLDPDDGAAAAVVSWLGGAGADPAAWLARRLEEVALAREGGGPIPAAFAGDPRVAALRALHPKTRWLAPAEAMDHAILAAGLPELLRGWPDAPARLANLEALRGAAVLYEQGCRSRRQPCTLAGLCTWLATLEGEADAPARPSRADAVHVTTWHAAKGLEWPVVVLTDLDFPCRDSAFGVHVVPNPAGFDPDAPLAGRTLRYWPWPYGALRTAALAEVVADSEIGRAVRAREHAERARLLYVGFTRARDRLVFFGKVGAVGWLDELRTEDGGAALTLPWEQEPGPREAKVGDQSWPCLVRWPSGRAHAGDAPEVEAPRWLAFAVTTEPRPPELLHPSAEAEPADMTLGPAIPLGPRSPLDADDEDAREPPPNPRSPGLLV